jgi:hypothetical protein
MLLTRHYFSINGGTLEFMPLRIFKFNHAGSISERPGVV